MHAQESSSGSRDDLTSDRLAKMATFWNQLRKSRDLDESALAARGMYVRLGGESVRLISLDRKAPLCALESEQGPVKNTSQISDLITLVKNGKITPKIPGGTSTMSERKVQRDLIEKALLNGRRFEDRFPGLEGHGIDQLMFICDELRVDPQDNEACRADIIALGRKGDVFFPVYIELKYGSELTVLVKQLETIRREMSKPQVVKNFVRLLSTVSRVAVDSIDMSLARIMLIWPKSKSGGRRTSTTKCISDHSLIAYDFIKTDSVYSFQPTAKSLVPQFD